jgi:hypothetical protein
MLAGLMPSSEAMSVTDFLRWPMRRTRVSARAHFVRVSPRSNRTIHGYRLLLYPAGRPRLLLPFEMLQVLFKLSDARSEREHVFTGRIINAFQSFDEARNLGS